ncbi:MAG TPA: LysM peptidoglycan-binding domain-containing protein [Ktedonobacteraceae bacterium]
MQSQNFVYRFFHQQHENRFVVGKFTFIAIFGLLALTGTLYANVSQAHAATTGPICSGSEQAYTVMSGDTLSGIATHYGTTLSSLATSNAIANPDLISAGQQICVPDSTATTLAPAQASSSDVASMITSIFGSYAGSAMAIATCESGLNPGATNSIAIGDSHAEGVFQILYPSTWSTTSEAGSSPYDAYSNIVAAHQIFTRDGNSWREWACQA